MKPKRWTDYMRVAELPSAMVNPKGHAGALIAEGITTHGFAVPLVLDERTGRLLAGHGRRVELLRMAAEGEDPPDGIGVDSAGFWLVPVNRGWSSLDDDQAHAAALLINVAPTAGGFVSSGLVDLLEHLERTRGLAATGFGADNLDRLRAELGRDGAVRAPAPPPPDRKRRERQINPVVCPECGHEFHPAPATR